MDGWPGWNVKAWSGARQSRFTSLSCRRKVRAPRMVQVSRRFSWRKGERGAEVLGQLCRRAALDRGGGNILSASSPRKGPHDPGLVGHAGREHLSRSALGAGAKAL